ncbi:PIN domain-containing protein [Cereibacter sphaeroides]|uniref:PIN domain-containing protein n=1 Tax=Cereibacter sphaeroides TaxID=1063 RepID=UPI001F41B6CE|nr:type II toxin-antitoxin system VapC family toxin [Cereibacter sphaeroides]MCE6967351.1 type II toxin-antitoxin system VapC family toxin [Cereibacter sphaeroides]
MIGLDTNVLVRFLVQDDPAQGAAAARLLGGLTRDNPGWICRETAVELVWVLERAYRLGRAEVSAAVEGLLEAEELVVEAADRVGLALSRYRQGGPGFSDQMILIAAGQAGCERLYSFDRKLTAAGAEPVPAAG